MQKDYCSAKDHDLLSPEAARKRLEDIRKRSGMTDEQIHELWRNVPHELLRGKSRPDPECLTRDAYFEKICDGCQTDRDRIAALILARGFLLEKRGVTYGMNRKEAQLNGNVLNDELTRLDLGRVESGEVIIADGVGWETAKALFDSAEIGGEVCTYRNVTWSEFARFRGEIDVDTSRLEPFIAFYVRAANLCGVKTVGCCDGNHPGKYKAFLQFYGEPFRIWHRFLIGVIGNGFYSHWNEKGSEIHFGEQTQYDRYYSLYKAARFLLINHEKIMWIKDEWMNLLSPEDLATQDSKEAVLWLREIVPSITKSANLQVPK